MPGLMTEEEHRPQGSDTTTGDGKPDEAVSGMRQRPLRAFHLSTPYRRKVTRLMPTKYMMRIPLIG